MDTANDSRIEVAERTMPEEIATLDVEVQAMFDRVRTRLGLEPGAPEMIDRYELRGSRIGAGGMGTVYRAYDAELEREVAIKVVSARSLTNVHKLRERLSREAKVLAKLVHPNVVTVHDAGVDQGRVFLVMELIHGETLRARQESESSSLAEQLRLFVEAGKGLAAAHARGIVHRDFKPDNVFVSDAGQVKVGDFGLAYVLGDHEPDEPSGASGGGGSEPMTRTGEFLGTLGYMAPEQLRGERPDARSDQYAFFVSLWESLCGQRPYEADSREELLEAIERHQPQTSRPLPSRVHTLLMVGLAPRRELRYPDMDAAIRAIERELERPVRVRRRVLGSVAGVTTLAGVAAIWFAFASMRPDCALADQFAAQASTQAWATFTSTVPDPVAARFERHLDELERDARDVCMDADLGRQQRLEALLRRLQLLHELDPQDFAKFADEFEHALSGRPTQPLSPAVDQFIAERIEPREGAGLFGPASDAGAQDAQIIAAAGEGLDELARTPIDRAELSLRRGRAYSRHGDYELAVEDFRAARRLAEYPPDPERRLQANIEAGKTMIMRGEDPVRSGEFVNAALDIMAGFGEPLASPRRAELDEVSASLARRAADTDAALRLQWGVVWRHALAGRTFQLIPALVNLGIVYEERGDLDMAERCYQTALTLDPHDVEALLSLGRLLVNDHAHRQRPDEARALLGEVVRSGYPDTQLPAVSLLLFLEIQLDNVSGLEQPRRELLDLLASEHPRTRTHEREAWQFVAYSYAIEGRFGPELETAMAELATAQGELEETNQAWLEVFTAQAAGAAHRDVAERFYDAAAERLDRVSADERESLRVELEAARRELEQPESP